MSRPESAHIYKVSQVGPDSEDFIAAKKLHASVYLAKDFVSESDLEEDIIHHRSDPHQNHAEYFVVKRRNVVVAVARQIVYKGVGEHHESYPVLSKAIIFERSRQRIISHHPKEIVEISALVKMKGESSIVPLLLYRALWRHSYKKKHRLWIMACDVRLYERLKILFGATLTRIGQRTPYKGGDVIPVAIDLPRAYNYVRKLASTSSGMRPMSVKRRAAKFMLKESDI